MVGIVATDIFLKASKCWKMCAAFDSNDSLLEYHMVIFC